MKSLLLKDMLLVSHVEKKARKISFGPSMNVILGENDTGKSALIKSIYYALGAEPHGIHHRWRSAEVGLLLRFSVDDTPYSIYRRRKSFSLFGSDDQLIGTYSSITNELGPKLAEILGFKLKLLSRDGVPLTPPPAYLFLPFYIDQDKGWIGPWSSFRNLSQFPNWKRMIAGYHFGIRPDQWYELDAEKRMCVSQKETPERERAILCHLVRKTKARVSSVDFNIDIEQFQQEISDLLEQCDSLRITEERYKSQLTRKRTEKIRLEAQIEIVSRTHDELSADYKFAVAEQTDVVGCPTCGAQYENSFAERFEIATDTETCIDLLQSLRDDLTAVEHEIRSLDALLSTALDDERAIHAILARKQGQVKLADVIEIRGKRELLEHLESEIATQDGALAEVDQRIARISDEMAVFDDPNRRKGIVDRYEEVLDKYCAKLNVDFLDDRVFRNIVPTIDETGSDMPRAVLAYQFTVLDAIERKKQATFCPIVIDAPNQQEQDKANLEKILNFIKEIKPKGRQLVLGLVDNCGLDFGGHIVELTTKNSLLEEAAYHSVSQEIREYEVKNLQIV